MAGLWPVDGGRRALTLEPGKISRLQHEPVSNEVCYEECKVSRQSRRSRGYQQLGLIMVVLVHRSMSRSLESMSPTEQGRNNKAWRLSLGCAFCTILLLETQSPPVAAG